MFRGFARNDKNSSKRETDGELNGAKLRRLKTVSKVDQNVMSSLCGWVSKQEGFSSNESGYNNCLNGKQIGLNKEKLTLTGFLESERARNYFSDGFWEKYKEDKYGFSLLTLMYLFSDSLANIKYDQSWSEINSENGKILKSLFEQNLKFVYLSSSKNDNNLESVTLHSDGAWDLTFCKENGCKKEKELNLTIGDKKFCVSNLVCVDDSIIGSKWNDSNKKWKQLHQGQGALWSKYFQKNNWPETQHRLLIGLIAACFNNETKVSLSINANPEKGEMLLKKLN